MDRPHSRINEQWEVMDHVAEKDTCLKVVVEAEDSINNSKKNEVSNKSYNTTCDRSTIKCFNCNVYGRYAAEYRKPRRDREKDKEQNHASNLTQFEDDEPTLQLTEIDQSSGDII